ncbi:hypothetical protein WN48_06499 [Eufriesea mexicana]|uniref:Uncharacterized protein n=1 Tax=Eufriesea mexicana TaxID=516756 RepID=A0A310S8M7_9HYME|nr:hypothetical protein WN48_06499 [Eufriesea mexicana]
MASASEVGEEYEDGDDSDMFMEPESTETEQPDREETIEEGDEKETEGYKNVTEEAPPGVTVTTEEVANSTTERTKSKDQEAENTKEADQTDAPDTEDKSLETDSQNFFPSFAELFANHRAPFMEQQRYRPNRFLGYFQRDRSSGYQTAAATAKDVHHPLLGSGNFGVIRGGTYYPEDKETDEYTMDDSLYNPYYHGNNRGRTNYFRNPKPQPVRGGDFFANFRDFADITAPPKSSFSHLSVVYANKNGSTTGRITEPRNIIETLRMLEEEGQTSSEEIPHDSRAFAGSQLNVHRGPELYGSADANLGIFSQTRNLATRSEPKSEKCRHILLIGGVEC